MRKMRILGTALLLGIGLLLGAKTACLTAAAQEEGQVLLSYEELGERICTSSPQVQAARTSLEQWTKVYEAARDQVMENRERLRKEAEKRKEEGDRQAGEHYEEQARQLKKSAQQLERQIRSLNSTSKTMDIRQTQDRALMAAQDVMMAWHTVKLDLETAQARLDQAEKNLERLGRTQALGMTAASATEQAEKELQAARNQVKSLQDDRNRLQSELGILTGYGAENPPVPDSLPAPDREKARSLNLEEDKKKAWGNSYELRAQRHSGYSGTNRQVHSQQSLNRQEEENMYAGLEALYQQVQTALAADEAAGASFCAQELSWQEACTKQSLGLLNQGEYDQARTDYLEARARRGQAQIRLLQAMEHYSWAVQGLM